MKIINVKNDVFNNQGVLLVAKGTDIILTEDKNIF